MAESSVAYLKQKEADSGVFTLYPENIMCFEPSERTSKDIEKAAEGFAIFDELIEDGLAGLIIDLRKLKKGVKKEVKDYVAKRLDGKLYGTAVLVDSNLSKIIGNIILNFLPKGPHLRKIFNDLGEAIRWLEKQKQTK